MPNAVAHDQADAAEPVRPKQSRADAVMLARRQFIDGQRIEMGPLADELGVSRMTLNRWVGSRDRLLGEINWMLARQSLEDAKERADSTGIDLVADTMEGFIATVLGASFQRSFVQQEGEIALRILTTRSSDLQSNWIAYVGDLIREQVPDAHIALPVEDLAYLIVRIAESFCYVDMITGGEPDATKVGVAVRALLT